VLRLNDETTDSDATSNSRAGFYCFSEEIKEWIPLEKSQLPAEKRMTFQPMMLDER
jgi:hypothetical protein